jgi:hypothetical protein
MRTSFHHQPEAQHPNFQLSTSWQADYPIFLLTKLVKEGLIEKAGYGRYRLASVSATESVSA